MRTLKLAVFLSLLLQLATLYALSQETPACVAIATDVETEAGHTLNDF
jgi:hypothetical protein